MNCPSGTSALSPLYSQLQTSSGAVCRSAQCHQRTSAVDHAVGDEHNALAYCVFVLLIAAGVFMDVQIRQAKDADSEICGLICYQAFKAINDRHGFLSNLPSVEIATDRIRAFIKHPAIFAVIAEADGRVVGFNFLSEHDPIRGIGPIVIDPAVQSKGIGRRLMAAVLERARGARGIRLVQEAFNMQSLALYSGLGFEAKEFLVVMIGTPRSMPMSGYEVRRMEKADITDCELLHQQVHGFPRTNELQDRLATGSPIVAVRNGRIRAYIAVPTVWLASHGVAESDEDMRALLLGAAQIEKASLSFLLPIQFAKFFEWCLTEGFRTIKPMTIMSMGEYNDPKSIYFASVIY